MATTFPRHSDRLQTIADRTSELADKLSYASLAATRNDVSTAVTMRHAFAELEQIGRMLNQASEEQGWGYMSLGADFRLSGKAST